jgi:hypothetical protein
MSERGAGRTDRAWRRIRAYILDRDGWHCYLCRRPIDPSLSGRHPYGASVDHLDNDRHNNHPTNLRACHLRCNTAKENRRRRRRSPRLNTSRQW